MTALRVSCIVVALLCAAPSVLAHQVGLSRGTWAQSGNTITAELTFARGDAERVCPGLDGARCDLTLFSVATEAPCPAKLEAARLEEEDGYALRVAFSCTAPGRTVVDLTRLMALLPSGHRHLGSAVTLDQAVDVVAYASGGAASATFSLGEAPKTPPVLAYLHIGVDHILRGFDHLVFLFGLVLVGGRLRSLLAVVTAFTLAHSVSLALAVLDVVRMSPSVVEPLIALSIAIVGIENFFIKDASGRWRITAPFGLIHGFGFAGALAEVGVPKDAVAPALLLFNVGVELGQVLVLAVVLPLLWLLRKRIAVFAKHGTRVLSTLVVLAGVFWFVERVFLS